MSFGLHKSASTYTFLVLRKLLQNLGADPEVIDDDLFLKRDNSDQIWTRLQNPDSCFLVKTHRRAPHFLQELKHSIKSIANIRDPRDIALSMIDAGKDSREKKLDDSMREVYGIHDAANLIRLDVNALKTWIGNTDTRILPFQDICFNSKSTFFKATQWLLGQSPTKDAIEEAMQSIKDEKNFRFNVGIQCRYKSEMSDRHSAYFLDRFSDFYLMNLLLD
ncbi:MAG: hypothetical protein AAGG02_10515 [Cyanobacteria bacterium P01_H01_bin.15]